MGARVGVLVLAGDNVGGGVADGVVEIMPEGVLEAGVEVSREVLEGVAEAVVEIFGEAELLPVVVGLYSRCFVAGAVPQPHPVQLVPSYSDSSDK